MPIAIGLALLYFTKMQTYNGCKEVGHSLLSSYGICSQALAIAQQKHVCVYYFSIINFELYKITIGQQNVKLLYLTKLPLDLAWCATPRTAISSELGFLLL